MENGFLYSNNALRELSLPKLKVTGPSFLRCNKKLTILNLPRLTYKGRFFLDCHRFKEYLIENMYKASSIKPSQIAELDKKEGITTVEANNVGQAIKGKSELQK